MGEDPDDATNNKVMLPDDLDEPQQQQPSPLVLRRVVSDFTGVTRQTPPSKTTVVGSAARVLPLSFRPRGISHMSQYDHSEVSMEDDIILEVPSGGTLLPVGEKEGDDVPLEHEMI